MSILLNASIYIEYFERGYVSLNYTVLDWSYMNKSKLLIEKEDMSEHSKKLRIDFKVARISSRWTL